MSLLRTNGSNKKKKHGGISINNSNLSTPLISPSRNTHEHRNKRKSHNKKMGIFAKQRESKEKARNLWGKFRRDTGGLGVSEILAISVVPKEPPMPPAEEEDERSRLSSSPVDEALL